MKIQNLLIYLKEVQASSDGKTWHPVRMKSAENTFLWQRVKSAWRVLKGDADSLDWGDWK